MLKYGTQSDTDKVKAWLALALEAGRQRGLTASGLAAYCGVKAQAITGWKRTGRVTKSNLAKAAEYFGHDGPSFSAGPLIARERIGQGWPFPDIEPHRFAALTPAQKIEIQGVVRERLDRFDEARSVKQKPSRASTKKHA